MARAPVSAGVTPNEDELNYEDDEEVLDPTGEGGEDGQGDDETPDAPGQASEDEALVEDEDVVEAAPRSRAERRIERLQREIAELKARPAPTAAQPPPVQTGPVEETDEQFRARLALMNPTDQMLEIQTRSERRFATFVRTQTLANQDSLDRSDYAAKAAALPGYKRHAAAVEQMHQELMQKGQLVPREVLLDVVIGRKVRASWTEEGPKRGRQQVRRQAAQNVQRQQARPVNARGDVQPNRREQDARSARAKRLDGMQI
jgi:hypothetical protein